MNYTAENSLITTLVMCDRTGGTYADQAASILLPSDFQEQNCRRVFAGILKLREQNLPVEMSAIHEQMVKNGDDAEQAMSWLVDASNGVPLIYGDPVGRYGAKIKEISRAHQLSVSIGLAGERIRGGENIAEIKAEMISEIEFIEADQKLSQDRAIGDVIMPALDAMADRLSGDESKRGLRTGIERLDTITTGLNRGEFWIVGAMPGRGKTALALQIALNVCGDGFPVLIISMEMSTAALIRRLLKMRFGSAVIEHPSQEQWKQIVNYSAELKTLPLFINESSSLEAAAISQHARMMIARHGVRLVIVDYLQIVRGPGRDRRERTGDAANVLRALAKDTGVPVLALSQLRRPENINDRPSMIELKESGDLEAHANVVLLIHMPINDDGTFTGEEEIIIGKQREGPIGTVPVFFERSKVRFHERTKQ